MFLIWSPLRTSLFCSLAVGLLLAAPVGAQAQSYHFTDQPTRQYENSQESNPLPTGIVPVKDPRIQQPVQMHFSSAPAVAPPSMKPVPFFPQSPRQIVPVSFQQQGTDPPFADIPVMQDPAEPSDTPSPSANPFADEPPVPDMSRPAPAPAAAG